MSTGNTGLDALADAIAEHVIARMQEGKPERLLTVEEAAKYLGRRHELDRWIELRQGLGRIVGFEPTAT